MKGTVQKHYTQMLPGKLISQCEEAGKVLPTPPNRIPVTFHEVRSLFTQRAADAGYAIEHIQHDMAHTDRHTTLEYQSIHALLFSDHR